MRRKRLSARVRAAVCRAALKFSDCPRVLLNSGAVLSVRAVLAPCLDGGAVSVGAIGSTGVWIFPIDEWKRVAGALESAGSERFVISDGESLWSPDVGASVVVLPELGVARVSCLRVVGKRG